MANRTRAFLLLLAASPIQAWAQVPAGPEFRVNTYTSPYQHTPAAAADPRGELVVTWDLTTLPGEIGAQRYDGAGGPRGGEFHVGTNTEFDQRTGGVALDANGNFVVTWAAGPGASSLEVFAQRYDASGAPRGAELHVSTATRWYPDVASDSGGNFVVVWDRLDPDFITTSVFAQRYDVAGVPRGAEFRVNTYTPLSQGFPRVSSDPSGNVVVVWRGADAGDDLGVFARRYDAQGAPMGSEFRVNTYTTSNQLDPAVAHDASGNFVVVWAGSYQDGDSLGILGQRFDATGAPRGGEFQVNTFTAFIQRRPRVASDARGNFVVAWQSFQDGNSYAVIAQRYDAAGTRRGSEFRVNTFTNGAQMNASVASDAFGNVTVVWGGPGPSDVQGVFGQRYGGLQPAALDVDTASNRVFEPGDEVDLRPTWRNVNGLAQTFGGTLANFGGPAGAVYFLGDPTASYGTVANGTSGQCTDCYVVSVSNPPVRPVTHWDASVTETITPDTHGQQIRWLLHLGDSFTDVPRANPFYRFVETLLHRGITSGCTNTTYCPSSPTTREQMAVFVLLAREGPGYTPAACAPPNIFGDVPETSPFCRYIEELSNRGVVSGCGGGDYCPTAAVTREQMAVFVLRTLDPTLDPPACGTPVFNDVPASSPFCRWIEQLARRGVVTGCGGGNYCPTAAVTREQMGVFLGVTFGLTLYGP